MATTTSTVGTGNLQVIVNAQKASVFVGGVRKGEISSPQVLNIENLPVGQVQVRIEAPTYRAKSLIFEIQADAWTQALFTLEKEGSVTVTGVKPPPPIVPSLKSARAHSGSITDPSSLPGITRNAGGLWETTVRIGGISIELIEVPPGEFLMGSDQGQPNEVPVHKVTIANSFWMSKYPVTQLQWQEVMRFNPSKFKTAGLNTPVESVSWSACQAFTKRLNESQYDRLWTFRLPSEAEWEYACHAGSKESQTEKGLEDIAWYRNNSGNTTHPVGRKVANDWGLHDMLGNVWQWCEDLQHDDYDGAPVNGAPWTMDSYCLLWGQRVSMASGFFKAFNVARGGSWNSEIQDVRASRRSMYLNEIKDKELGFRVVAILK